MITGIWGRKIGMTQLFIGDKVVPVTAIDLSDWFITQIRTKEKDGHDAIQVGCLRNSYKKELFSKDWTKKLKHHFSHVREIKVTEQNEQFSIGKSVAEFVDSLQEGSFVDVSGNTRGRGFAGTIKRHNFNHTPKSHGCTMGRRPGSLSFMRSQGRVIKGKRLPGHMGNRQRMTKNLAIVKVESDAKVVLVKGAIPGHSGSLVFIRKA